MSIGVMGQKDWDEISRKPHATFAELLEELEEHNRKLENFAVSLNKHGPGMEKAIRDTIEELAAKHFNEWKGGDEG